MACRTRAAAARIHRLRAGPLTLDDALLFTEWNCDNCLANVESNSRLVEEMERKMLESGGTTYDDGGGGGAAVEDEVGAEAEISRTMKSKSSFRRVTR